MNVFKRSISEIIKSSNKYHFIQLNNINRTITSYKSALALEHLYPNSSLTITDPKPPSNEKTFSGYIPIEQLQISYSRSSGPGGQNVNKVNTKVEIRFQLESVNWLDNNAKEKLAQKFATKLTKDGYLIFKSDLTRSQQLNLADCLEKIRQAIKQSLEVKAEPSIESQERARRRLERAARERLLLKRERSQIKNDRRDSNIAVE